MPEHLIEFRVEGMPEPQGNLSIAPKGPRRLYYQNDAELKAWKQTVAFWAKRAHQEAGYTKPWDVAVAVDLVFRLPRKNSDWRKDGGLRSTATAYPQVKPDLDKLARAVLDAMEGAIYVNDSRVVRLSAGKLYLDPLRAQVAGRADFPGVDVWVHHLEAYEVLT